MLSQNSQTVIATTTNGQLGNQMSAFSSLYALAKTNNDNIAIGIDYKQFSILANAFPFFEKHFHKYLMDSWYCEKTPHQFDWKYFGNSKLLKIV